MVKNVVKIGPADPEIDVHRESIKINK